MSVINQMLKDLDRRRREQRGGYAHVLELWERWEEDLPVSRRQIVLLALMLSVLAGAGVWSWKKIAHKPFVVPEISRVTSTAQPVAAPGAPVPLAPAPAKTADAPVLPPASPAATSPPVVMPSTAPVAVAVSAPSATHAKAENLTPVTKPQGSAAMVPAFELPTPVPPVVTALPAAPPPSVAAATTPRVAETPPPMSVAKPVPAAPAPPPRAEPQTSANKKTEAERSRAAHRPPPLPPPPAKPKPAALPTPKLPAATNGSPAQPVTRPYSPVSQPPIPLRIRPSDTVPVEQRDQYRQAQELVATGDFGGAMEALRRVLQSAPDDMRARLALADIHVDLGQKDQAQAVLKDGLRRKPGEAQFSILYAKLLAEDGDNETALAVLNEALSVPGGGSKDLLAFAAALNQQSGRYIQAERNYRLLLRQQADNGIWLMGLAIALQQQSKNTEALEAFRQALYSGGMAPPVQRFISEQIRLLER